MFRCCSSVSDEYSNFVSTYVLALSICIRALYVHQCDNRYCKAYTNTRFSSAHIPATSTRGFRARVWGGHEVSAECKPIPGIWGQRFDPAGSRGRTSGCGVRGEGSLKLNAFWHYHNPMNLPICYEICFCRKTKNVGRLGARPNDPLTPASGSGHNPQETIHRSNMMIGTLSHGSELPGIGRVEPPSNFSTS